MAAAGQAIGTTPAPRKPPVRCHRIGSSRRRFSGATWRRSDRRHSVVRIGSRRESAALISQQHFAASSRRRDQFRQQPKVRQTAGSAIKRFAAELPRRNVRCRAASSTGGRRPDPPLGAIDSGRGAMTADQQTPGAPAQHARYRGRRCRFTASVRPSTHRR